MVIMMLMIVTTIPTIPTVSSIAVASPPAQFLSQASFQEGFPGSARPSASALQAP